MKNKLIAIFVLFVLIIGSTQTYASEATKTGMDLALHHLNNSTQTYEDQKRHLASALDYGQNNTKLSYINTLQPILTVSIIDSKTVTNPHNYSVLQLDVLSNLVGETGLTAIHDALMKQNQRITTAKDDWFADLDSILPVYFTTQDNNGSIVSRKVDFKREKISSVNPESSVSAQLQHCLSEQNTTPKLTERETIENINKMMPKKSSNKSSNTPYIVAGIGAGLLLLLFIAHKLNLLPTELPTSFKNILPRIN